MSQLRSYPGVPIRPLNWLQGRRREFIDWTLPWSFYNTGDVDQGKGALGFAIASNYLAEGPNFGVDVFGSDNDSETLTWFKSPYKDETAAIVDDSWAGDMGGLPHFKVSEFSIEKAKQYKMVVTDRVLFRGEASHYASLGRIFEVIRNRRGYKQEPGKPIMALIVREARKVIHAQITSNMSRDEQDAQWAFVDLNAQRAHSGIAPVVDSQRHMDVHITYRDLASFKFLKGFGGQTVAGELDWIFNPFFKMKWLATPLRPRQFWASFLRNMNPRQFVCLDRWNGVCHGVIGEIDWLKYKGYDLAEILGIHPAFDKPKEAKRQRTLSPKAIEMLAMHKRVRELEEKGLDPKTIATQLEFETDRKMTAAGVRYHMSVGSCSCEYKESGEEKNGP